MEKCNSLCSIFNQLTIPTSNIHLAVQTIAIPALSYSLPATTISEKYLNKISNKLANAILPKLGYNRHFPRVLALGPSRYGGMDLPDLYHLQGSSQVEQGYWDHVLSTHHPTTTSPVHGYQISEITSTPHNVQSIHHKLEHYKNSANTTHP
jgi:hypothetical protein